MFKERCKSIDMLRSSECSLSNISDRKNELLNLASLLPFLFILILPVLDKLVTGPGGEGLITAYDWQRIVTVIVLISCLVLSLCSGGRPDLLIGRGNAVLLLGFFGLGIISLLVNGMPWWDGLHELGNMALLALAFWGMTAALAGNRMPVMRQAITLCLVGSALLYLAIFFDANSDNLFAGEYVGEGILFPTFSNIRFFSDYQAFLLPYLIYAVTIYCRHPLSRFTGWIMIFLFMMLFFFSGSRVTIMGQGIAHLVMFSIIGKRYLPTLKSHLIGWVGAYCLYLTIAILIPYYLLGTSASSVTPILRGGLSLRDYLWRFAWNDIVEHPWLGIGPGEFSRQLNPVAAGPHNSVLMLGAEWGIPAALLAVTGLMVLLFRAMKRTRILHGDDFGKIDFSIASGLSFLALVAHSLVANVLVIPTSQLCLLLSGCLLVAGINPEGTQEKPITLGLPLGRMTFIFAAVTSSIIMVLILVRDVPQLPGRNRSYLECLQPTPFFSPRFWQQGWLIDKCSAAQPQR